MGHVIAHGHNADNGKGETEECAADIAHEDSRRWAVIHQKSEASRNKRITDDIDKVASHQVGDDAEESGNDNGDAASQAIKAIHEIKGVRKADDPYERDGIGEPADMNKTYHRQADLVNDDAKYQDDECGDELG